MVNFVNGFELCEKIFAIDINVKVCFMSSGEINREALTTGHDDSASSAIERIFAFVNGPTGKDNPQRHLLWRQSSYPQLANTTTLNLPTTSAMNFAAFTLV
jgi:hypothetical protein